MVIMFFVNYHVIRICNILFIWGKVTTCNFTWMLAKYLQNVVLSGFCVLANDTQYFDILMEMSGRSMQNMVFDGCWQLC